MQSLPRQADRLQYILSPAGIHVSHYNTQRRRRQVQSQGFSGPRGFVNPTTTSQSGPSLEGTDKGSFVPHTSKHVSVRRSQAATSRTQTTAQRRRERDPSFGDSLSSPKGRSLSLKDAKNRKLYHSIPHVKNVDRILDQLINYGFETSSDIAKMQPWQLRILKKEIPQIDAIYLAAFPLWGKKDFYDETQCKLIHQFSDSSIWLEHNEIELIMKCFDPRLYGYRCFLCGDKSHEVMDEMDKLRWHIHLKHRSDRRLKFAMEDSRKSWAARSIGPAIGGQTSSSSPPSTKPSATSDVIDLVDSDNDLMDIDTTTTSATAMDHHHQHHHHPIPSIPQSTHHHSHSHSHSHSYPTTDATTTSAPVGFGGDIDMFGNYDDLDTSPFFTGLSGDDIFSDTHNPFLTDDMDLMDTDLPFGSSSAGQHHHSSDFHF